MVLPHEIIIQPALRPNLEKAFGSNASLRGSTEAAAPLRLVCSFCSAANALFYASAAEQFFFERHRPESSAAPPFIIRVIGISCRQLRSPHQQRRHRCRCCRRCCRCPLRPRWDQSPPHRRSAEPAADKSCRKLHRIPQSAFRLQL